MAVEIQRRRGSTAAHAAFTGALGEITVDTDKNVAIVHNSVQAGGFPLAGTMFPNVFSESQTIDVVSAGPVTSLALQTDSISRINFFKTGDASFLRQEADTSLAALTLIRRGTTGNALAALSSGSGIGAINFLGYDGTAFAGAGAIRMFSSEAWTPTNHGTKLFFLTVPAGSTTQTTHATLDSTVFSSNVPVFISSFANANALRVSNYSLTGSNAQQLATFAGTWNTTGDPTAIHLNILDTASGALSKLLDLQTNSVSRFSVSKTGDVVTTGSLGTLSELTLADSALLKWNTRSVISSPANGVLRLTNNAETDFTRLALGGTTAAFPAIGRNGTALEIFGADGAGPSALQVYRTKTSATNFERLNIQWAGISAQILTEAGSAGGTDRALELGTAGLPRLIIDPTGLIEWGSGFGKLHTDGSLEIDDGAPFFNANVTTGTVEIATVFSADRGAASIGFFGAGVVTQQNVLQLSDATAGGTADTVDTFAGSLYTTDAPVIEGNFHQLALKVNQIIAALENYGLLAP